MADYLIQDTTLDAIANAINAKTGGSSAMTPAQMVTAIGTISGGGSTSPYKIVKGTITPASDTAGLSFPCADITTVLYLVAKVLDYSNYISEEYNGMGLGIDFNTFEPNFDGRTYSNSKTGHTLGVYQGAFDFWQNSIPPTMDTSNQTASVTGNSNLIFKAGIAIEYFMMGV